MPIALLGNSTTARFLMAYWFAIVATTRLALILRISSSEPPLLTLRIWRQSTVKRSIGIPTAHLWESAMDGPN